MTYPLDPRVDRAREWSMREVLGKLPPLSGVKEHFGELVGPCPSCGGTDRFSVNVKSGVYNCRSCGGGDPIALVRLVMGLDFMGAVEFLEGAREAEIDPAELERRRKLREDQARKDALAQANYRAWARRDAVSIWRAALPFAGTPAADYLALRVPGFEHLTLPFKCFRFLPAHPYVKKIGKRRLTLHRGPVLVSAVQGPDGTLQAVHQTWIDLTAPKGKPRITGPDGEVMPAKMVRGSKKGGAIRLTGTACGAHLVMGEGNETTLTALVADAALGASYWAGVDLGNMAGKQTGPHTGFPDLGDERAFLPPRHVDRLTFIQDGDSDPKQTRAKLMSGLRRARHHNPALSGSIVPAPEGMDLNDTIKREKRNDERA